eukprot:scaffold36380_cov50-Phaeocystis_antarctica.AAC.2
MRSISVTLEVSKFSGCLNAHANCRVSKGEGIRCTYDAGRGGLRAARKEDAAPGVTSSVQGWARLQTGGPGPGRSALTLDVSKLSGWLNALAYCQAERRAYDAGRGAGREMGGPRAMAAQSACRGGPDYIGWGAQARGGAHVEHVAHVGDAGGVEAQRLVEHPRILPRVVRRRTMRDEVQAGGAGGGGRPRCTRRAGRMSVTLEVSTLSGWLNADASCRESKEGHTVWREVRASRRRPACSGGSTADSLQNRRGAHPEHIAHACDAGGIPAGDVRVEVLQAIEKVAHVGDG